MKTPLQRLYLAQFLSAFVDNAIFFILLGLLKHHGVAAIDATSRMDLYQAMFLLSFILFAPVVGAFAERNPKSFVLLVGNAIKAVGVIMFAVGMPAGLCYFIVGFGAVVYSPAKYGILTELTRTPEQLLEANGRLEGYTIMAILFGSALGGQMAEALPDLVNLMICFGMYVFSMIWANSIPRVQGTSNQSYVSAITAFFSDIMIIWRNPKTRFSLIGTAGFWMISAVLRLSMLVWLVEHLQIESPAMQSAIVACTAVGIVIGALLAPKLISMEKFYRAASVGVVLSIVLVVLVFSPGLWMLIPMLLLVGAFGGLFVVPMNAVLQHEGKPLIGSGKVIAIQNFAENIFMIAGIGIFTVMKHSFPINTTIMLMAMILLGIVIYLISQIRTVSGGRGI